MNLGAQNGRTPSLSHHFNSLAKHWTKQAKIGRSSEMRGELLTWSLFQTNRPQEAQQFLRFFTLEEYQDIRDSDACKLANHLGMPEYIRASQCLRIQHSTQIGQNAKSTVYRCMLWKLSR